jgi:hypothetical protein
LPPASAASSGSLLAIFLIIMLVVLFGCWLVLGGGIKNSDIGAVAAVSGLVGTIVGAAGANASTALSTIFGSSILNPHASRTVNDASTTINAATIGAIDESTTDSPQLKASP